jgi:hypothetical protein
MPYLSRALTLCVILLGAGCGLTFDEAEFVANVCDNDEDCVDARCEPATGRCVATDPDPLRLGFAVFPSSDGSSGTNQGVTFPSLDLHGAGTHDFVMPSSIVAAGKVRQSSTGDRVSAQVRFIRASAFEGGSPSEITVPTTGEPQELSPGTEVDYQVRIPAGTEYAVRVEPTGDAARVFPPLELGSMHAPEDEDLWGLDVGYPSEFATVQGTIVSLADGDEVPENGLQVRAIEVATGRVISSTAITGMTSTLPLQTTEDGSFTIRLAPDAGPFILRVSGGEARPLFPTLSVDPDLVYPGSVVVPQLEPVRYEGRVEADPPSGRTVLEGAVVSLRSHDVFGDLPDVTGTFRATVTTDADGLFAVDVLPGTYDVIVTPSGHAELAVVAHGVRIEGENDTVRGQLFTVPPRARLGGSLEVMDGRPVPGVTLRATALGRMVGFEDVVGPFNRSTEAITDVHGLFTVHLDVGAYDLTFRPPSGSGFPWVVSPDRVVRDYGEVETRSFHLPAPVPLRGVVARGDGMPLSGAEIRAYALVESFGSDVRAIEVARAVTGTDGDYELLLPPRL